MHAYARGAFIDAKRYADRIVELEPAAGSLQLKGLTTALVTAYGRPFKQRRAVRLPDDIVPAEHRDAHESTIQVRDKIVAHRDLDGPITEDGFVSEVIVSVVGEELAVQTRSPHLSIELAQELATLSDKLIAEMNQLIDGFVQQHLIPQIQNGDAHYILSLDEAPSNWLEQQH